MSSIQQDVASHVISLDERVDISRAEDIYGKFEEALQRSDNIDIDAGVVERIDTTGFQILVAFCQAMEKRGRKIRLVKVSDVFTSNAKLLGLDAHLPAMNPV